MIPLSLGIDDLSEGEENGETETINNEESNEPDRSDKSEEPEEMEEPENPEGEKDPEDPTQDYNEMLKTLDYQTEIIEKQTYIIGFLIRVQIGAIVGLGFLILWRPTDD